jgi:hypothetical protein
MPRGEPPPPPAAVAAEPVARLRAAAAETDLEKACRYEIGTFCPKAKTDARIVKCLEPHAAQLSEPCKSWSRIRPPEATMVPPEMKAAAWAPKSPPKKSTAQKSILEQVGE